MPITFEEVTGEIAAPTRGGDDAPASTGAPTAVTLAEQVRAALEQEQRRSARLSAD